MYRHFLLLFTIYSFYSIKMEKMPRPKKKQRSSLADISALIPRAEFVIQAQNMATTITAEDRTNL